MSLLVFLYYYLAVGALIGWRATKDEGPDFRITMAIILALIYGLLILGVVLIIIGFLIASPFELYRISKEESKDVK